MNQYHKIENIYSRDTTTNKLQIGTFRMPEVELLKDVQWIATEKVDGTNVRVMWNGKEITFNGKTDNAQLHKDLITRLQEIFLPQTFLFAEKFGEKQVCLYGEGYGAGIQTGGCYKKTKDFILFDVLIDDVWLERGNVEGIAQMLGIEVVPIVLKGKLTEIIELVTNGLQSTWGDFIAEGIVARPVVELKTRFGDRIITKIKHRDFSAPSKE